MAVNKHAEPTLVPGEYPSPPRPSFAELLGILSYNQGLVEFADSKAGSLILLNSLLIAAVGALPSDGEMGAFKMLSVILCSVAVYLCFQVISSKGAAAEEKSKGPIFKKKIGQASGWEANDFIFFGCVTQHSNGDAYARAFEQSDEDARRNSLLQRTYVIAEIAKRKFGQYKMAQQVTSVALGVWVLVNLIPFHSA